MALSPLKPSIQRFYLIDILRLVSMFCIVAFHTYGAIYYSPFIASEFRGSFYGWSMPFPRNLSFSGFTILGLSVFLFGLHWPKKPRLQFLMGLVTCGIILLLVGQGDHFFRELVWEWDIYEFLIISLLLLFFLSSRPKTTYFLGAVGLVMTFIPIWQWSDQWAMPSIARDIFFGTCDGSGRGGWALLPNLGFVTFHFALGRFLKSHSHKTKIFEISPLETALWLVILALSFTHLGAYGDTDIGPGFYCYIFRKPPLVFWSHYIWILFLLRLSVVKQVNDFLDSLSIARAISSLQWSRSFGLCYFIHLGVIFVVSNWSEIFPKGSWQFDVFYLSVIPIVEILMRLFRYFQSQYILKTKGHLDKI